MDGLRIKGFVFLRVSASPAVKYFLTPASGKLRMPLVPFRPALKYPCRLHHSRIIQRAPDKLDPNRKLVVSKSAGHADGRKPADIADSANWISKRQSLIQVG